MIPYSSAAMESCKAGATSMKRPSASFKRPAARSAPPKKLKADCGKKVGDFVDGILDRYADYIIEQIQDRVDECEANLETLQSNVSSWPATVRLASACSGTEVTTIAGKAWSYRLNRWTSYKGGTSRLWNVVTTFTCEIDPSKQEWLMGNDLEGGHLFRDIKELGSGHARCQKHGGRMCCVESCDGFSYGFSCKSVSSANNNRAEAAGSLDDPDADSTTASTFHGGYRYAILQRPLWIVMENVLGLAAQDHDKDISYTDMKSQSNLDIVIAKYQSIQYYVQDMVLDSSHYDLPSTRRRIYIVALNMEPWAYNLNRHNISTMVEDVVRWVDIFKSKNIPNVHDFLLPNDHPWVLAALGSVQANDEKRIWHFDRAKHREYCNKNGVRWPLKLKHPKLVNSPWIKVMAPRQVDCVAFVEAKLGYHPDRIIHVAPSLDRIWTSDSGMLRTILPVGALFHMGMGRMLIGPELLSMQGIPYTQLPSTPNFSSSQLCDMAGNAFSGTVMESIWAAITISTEFSTESDLEEAKNLSKAMACLQR